MSTNTQQQLLAEEFTTGKMPFFENMLNIADYFKKTFFSLSGKISGNIDAPYYSLHGKIFDNEDRLIIYPFQESEK